MVAIWFVLGCLINSISIILLTVPIFAPIAVQLGFDPLAFAIIGILAIECGLLTPPFGLLVFTVKAAITDNSVPLSEIFIGSIPYWIVLLLVVAAIAMFPQIATFLPNLGIKRLSLMQTRLRLAARTGPRNLLDSRPAPRDATAAPAPRTRPELLAFSRNAVTVASASGRPFGTAMAMPVSWKPPSTMREPGNPATNGGSESRDSAKASALPPRQHRDRLVDRLRRDRGVLQRAAGGADGRGVGDADDADARPVDLVDAS